MIRLLQLVLLSTAVVLSPCGLAASRYWNLSGVQFADGATASGTFSYDDVTHEIASWNVRVTTGPQLLGFSYMPGNSTTYTYLQTAGQELTLAFDSEPGGMPPANRQLRITPSTPLDGTSATVQINLATAANQSGGVECFNCGFARAIVAGSLKLTMLPPPIAVVEIDEFYNAGLDHYFITADDAEKRDLDTHVHPGWTRTGQSFKAYAAGSSASGTINPVCRYYGNPAAGLDSHFYSASAAECLAVHTRFPDAWVFESDNVFQIDLPDPVTGACPGATVPVYRVWNNRADSNHRYTTSLATRASMIALGYVPEGYGPNAEIMCAVP